MTFVLRIISVLLLLVPVLWIVAVVRTASKDAHDPNIFHLDKRVFHSFVIAVGVGIGCGLALAPINPLVPPIVSPVACNSGETMKTNTRVTRVTQNIISFVCENNQGQQRPVNGWVMLTSFNAHFIVAGIASLIWLSRKRNQNN